ncbi:MAG: hypothetical protein HW386_1799 [Gammaproteobacteria bacterium]|nr:hypothetical protein [Gammaproteobacteria bacterium]
MTNWLQSNEIIGGQACIHSLYLLYTGEINGSYDTFGQSASQDLIDGYWFYEKQSAGIGEYFLDTLFSDIDSLIVSVGIHPIHFEKYHL